MKVSCPKQDIDKLEFGGESPLTMRHGRWAIILHPLGPSTISCYKIGICTSVVILSKRSESKDPRTWFLPCSG